MTTIDIIIIGLFIVTAIAGYRRGIIRQIGTVAGVVAGITACRCLSGDFARWLEARDFFQMMIGNAPELVAEHAAGVLSSTLLFVGAYIAVQIVMGMVRGCGPWCGAWFCRLLSWHDDQCVCRFSCAQHHSKYLPGFKQGGSVIDKSTLADGKVAEAVLNLAPRTFGVATAALQQYMPESKP